MKMQSLQALLLEELKDLYSAESQLLKALPRMAREATNPDLRAGFEAHLEQTRGQKERLERIFQTLGQKARAKTCEGMKGIIEEAESNMKMDVEGAAMDAMLIAAAQKAEHYEIAAYGAARSWAETLGLADATRLLQQTLDEERQTDAQLTALAVANVNALAAALEDEDEEEGDLDEADRGSRRGAHVLSSTGEDDEEDDQEREEIETAMVEDEEGTAHEISLGRANRRRADAPPSTQRRGDNRQRSKS